jgi:BMFP domain-containing protein YqiC
VDELVMTKMFLAENQSKHDELRRDLARTRSKLSAAAARYTKLEAMYASEKDARGKKK